MPDNSQAPEGLTYEGRLMTNPDAPSSAYIPAPSADVLTDEDDPPLAIIDRGFGPTGLGKELTDEEIEARAAQEDEPAADDKEPLTKPEAKEPQPSDASGEGDDVKEVPKNVPYDRFQELAAENQRLKQSEQILQWIMSNPEQAAAKLGSKGQPPAAGDKKPRFSLNIEEPSISKPMDQMSEQEQAQLWVQRAVYDVLKKSGLESFVGEVGSNLDNVLSFKDELQETLTRNAVDADGKPLHPRWNELRGTMSEVKARYSGMSDAEAYVLADRMIPQSTPMKDEMGMYNSVSQRPAPAAAPKIPPRIVPKKASSAALRAAKVASFGRASPGMTSVQPELMAIEKAAERAFEDLLDR